MKNLSQKTLYRIILMLVLGIFCLVNICSSLLVDRFQLKFDMTEAGLYDFSPITEEIALGLTQPVTIHVLCNEKDYPYMYQELLRRYSALSPQITVGYTDPYASPLFVDHYKQLGYSLSEMDILVQGSEGLRQIANGDTVLYDGGAVSGIQLEQQVSSALLYVTNPQKLTASFTAGHNERRTSALEGLFAANNFTLEDLYLASGEIESDVVVIAAPSRDFTETETAMLHAYLEGGGQVMVFVAPSVDEFPVLKAFLRGWNLSFSANVVMEERAYVSDNPLSLIPAYAPHAINRYFADNQVYVVMPSACSIELLSVSGAVKTQRVLLSSSASYANNDLQSSATSPTEQSSPGPFVLAATAQKDVVTPDGTQQAGVFLAGSRYLYADDILAVSSYANREFLTQVINFMVQDAVGISVPPKTLAPPPLAIRLDQSVAVGILLVGLVPVGILIFGLLVCRKRKTL